MKAKMLLIPMVFMSFVACHSQDVKSEKPEKEESKTPHEEVTVNRKYDKDGNLIAFDSTYTSYYSNYDRDSIDVDSLMGEFQTFFNKHFAGFEKVPVTRMDSAATSRFFQDDFFEQEFLNQEKHMRNMMNEMDSIKNIFFSKHGHG